MTQKNNEVKNDMGIKSMTDAHQCRVVSKGECEIRSRGEWVLQ